jgi:peptidyl-Lys metalloendopeptidase
MSSANRGAVMVDETTLWNSVAGTDDYVYGYSNGQWLADYYPTYAIWNADSYRYAAQYAP